MIRKATLKDAKAIANIYNYYVDNSIATFTESAITLYEVKENIRESIAWFVFEENDKILGYAYASAWKGRCAYRFTVETSVYLEPNSFGKGIGTKLYTHLLNELKKQNIHSVIGGISLPNKASEKLHENLGFKKAAHFKEVGFKFNKWIDVGYWELLLSSK
ncbi:MAG: N-acetyltransferase family protein [Flavobacteriaceae bacterium]